MGVSIVLAVVVSILILGTVSPAFAVTNPLAITLIGGNDFDIIRAFVVDEDGNIYVVWAYNTAGTVNSDGFRIFLRRGQRTADTTTITWSAAQQVGPDNFTQGPQVAVGPSGQVYVAYQNQSSASLITATSQLFSYSTDGGTTFTTGVFVSSVTPVNWYLSGAYHWARHMSFPTLGVSPKTGTIFLAWADRRNGDDDILLSKSTDGGSSWLSTPVRVNRDSSGNGVDQWHPA